MTFQKFMVSWWIGCVAISSLTLIGGILLHSVLAIHGFMLLGISLMMLGRRLGKAPLPDSAGPKL